MKTSPCVYILRLKGGAYKLGATSNLEGRLGDHRREGRLPPFELLHTIGSDAPKWAERYLHGVLSGHCDEGEVFWLPEVAVEWLTSLHQLNQYDEPTPPEGLAPRRARTKPIRRGLCRNREQQHPLESTRSDGRSPAVAGWPAIPCWFVIRRQDTEPIEVYPFVTRAEAEEFYGRASEQWSETYLCRIVRP
jgi:hypothetical protein